MDNKENTEKKKYVSLAERLQMGTVVNDEPIANEVTESTNLQENVSIPEQQSVSSESVSLPSSNLSTPISPLPSEPIQNMPVNVPTPSPIQAPSLLEQAENSNMPKNRDMISEHDFRKKKPKKNSKTILIVVVALLILLVGYFIYRDNFGDTKKDVFYTVKFNSNGGSLVEDQKVYKDGKVIKPDEPTKSGYIFKGWYLGNEEYNFDFSVTNNIIIDAKWEEKGIDELKSIKLDKNSIDMYVGESSVVVPTLTPDDVKTKLTWTSTNNKVAVVTNGVIKAVGVGTADITVESENNIKAKVVVNVTTKPVEVIKVTGVKLNRNSATIEAGKTLVVSANVTPDKATNKSVVWTSSNAKVATVYNGTIKGVGVGTATIKVTTVDGKFTDTISVTIIKPNIPITSIKLNKISLSLAVDGTERLTVTTTPANATPTTYIWRTSDESVATVKDGVITAVGEGQATITVATKDGTRVSRCYVTVK